MTRRTANLYHANCRGKAERGGREEGEGRKSGGRGEEEGREKGGRGEGERGIGLALMKNKPSPSGLLSGGHVRWGRSSWARIL